MKRILPLLGSLVILGLSLNHYLRRDPPTAPHMPAVAAGAASASEATPSPAAPDYTYRPASPDGIGKFFMGREISQVMGHQAINWLERGEREQEETPSRMIAALDLAPDTVLADIGAGSGFHAFLVARQTKPDGCDFDCRFSSQASDGRISGRLDAFPQLRRCSSVMNPDCLRSASAKQDAPSSSGG